MKDHAQVFHLTPTSINPLLWNPLQTSQRIDPATRYKALAEIYAGL